ncbi:MAG: SAM-dependent methyltransferase, partial [Proteobacteria bacterium]|nr:SAM-dependent methyltransferase [Pseudomonadota bacterium]
MNLIAAATGAATGAVERLPLPDGITRAGIALLVGQTGRKLRRASPDADRDFAAAMDARPIALHPDAANTQHYELPPEFFALVLGPRRKYSCCLYGPGDDLAAA